MRPADRFLILLVIAGSSFALSFVDAAWLRGAAESSSVATATLVEKFGLTDVALFTEARYTRHPSQADLHSAFQDHPAALEHFPTGALMPPPAGILTAYEDLDRKAKAPD